MMLTFYCVYIETCCLHFVVDVMWSSGLLRQRSLLSIQKRSIVIPTGYPFWYLVPRVLRKPRTYLGESTFRVLEHTFVVKEALVAVGEMEATQTLCFSRGRSFLDISCGTWHSVNVNSPTRVDHERTPLKRYSLRITWVDTYSPNSATNRTNSQVAFRYRLHSGIVLVTPWLYKNFDHHWLSF